MNGHALLGGLAGLMLLAASPAHAADDPPSSLIDPPPGPQDYIHAFPAKTWTFGALLWRGADPCTPDSCQAAYHADRLSILVERQKNCCGQAGYSVMITGRVLDCPASSYYLAWSKDIDPMDPAQKAAFLDRRIAAVEAGAAKACGATVFAPVPTADLDRLWTRG